MQQLDLTTVLSQVENFRYTVSNFPRYIGVYFVAVEPHLLYVGSANDVQGRFLSHERHQEFGEHAKRLKGQLTLSCVRANTIEAARWVEKICIRQFIPILNVAGKKTCDAVNGFDELLGYANNFYYDSQRVLFNGASKFYPRKFTKDALIWAAEYDANPSVETKLLAHIPFWENSKQKSVHYGGGDITGCRPMIDVELARLYKIRGYDQERLQKILVQNKYQRSQYIKEILSSIKVKKEFDWVEVDSLPKFLSVYCSKEPRLKTIYLDYSIPHRVEILHQILETVEHSHLIKAVKTELRQYY